MNSIIEAGGWTLLRFVWQGVLIAALFLPASVNAGPYAIQLRSLEMDAASGLVTLAWDVQNGMTYAIDESSDPRLGWEENVGGVQSYGSRMTTTMK